MTQQAVYVPISVLKMLTDEEFQAFSEQLKEKHQDPETTWVIKPRKRSRARIERVIRDRSHDEATVPQRRKDG